MKFVVGCDHAGKELAKNIIDYIKESGHDVLNVCTDRESANYAVEGIRVAENVSEGNADFGVVICGTGIGISIAANKVKNIRCALCHNVEYATLSRQHNNANVLALGARFIEPDVALDTVKAFINTDFEGGRHTDRVDSITDYEISCGEYC